MSSVFPPCKSANELKDIIQYIVDTVDHGRFNYPNSGFAIVGNFNKLNISDKLLYHDLFDQYRLFGYLLSRIKQKIVKFKFSELGGVFSFEKYTSGLPTEFKR